MPARKGLVYGVDLALLKHRPGEWIRVHEAPYGKHVTFGARQRRDRWPDYEFRTVRNASEGWARLYVRYMPTDMQNAERDTEHLDEGAY